MSETAGLESFTFWCDVSGSWSLCVCRPNDVHRGTEERNTYYPSENAKVKNSREGTRKNAENVRIQANSETGDVKSNVNRANLERLIAVWPDHSNEKQRGVD